MLKFLGPVGVLVSVAWKMLSGGGIDGMFQTIANAWAKSKDVDLAKYQAATDEQKAIGISVIGYEQARLSAEQNVIMSAMMHPIWWVAWALFVLPIGAYNLEIYFVSMFDGWLNVASCGVPKHGETLKAGIELCRWYAREVPAEQEAWARVIIPTIFGLQTGSGVVSGIFQAVRGKLK